MIDFTATYNMVHKFRAQFGEWWKPSSQEIYLMCAMAELGEVADAYVRMNASYMARNNQRDVDIIDELGDVLMMLLSAYPANLYPCQFSDNSLNYYSSQVEKIAAISKNTNEFILIRYSPHIIAAIALTAEMIADTDHDPHTVVLVRLQRIMEKHVPEEYRNMDWSEDGN